MASNYIKPLKDLCENFKSDIVDGPFGSNLKREDYTVEGIPVLKIQNVKPFKIELKRMDYVSEKKFEELKRHSFKLDDIVMTKLGDPLGACAIIKELDRGLIVADLVRIRAKGIDTKYLCYHLNSTVINELINSYSKGATRPRVRITNVRDLPIYVPPSPEQKRIVAKLDQCFEAIDKARANVERNLQNAKDLFQSKLNEIFSQKGDGWVEKRLGDCCTLQRGFDLPKRLRTKGDYPLVSSSGISDTHNEFKVTAPGVTTGRSGSIGKVFFIKDNFWPLNTVLYIKNFHDNYEKLIYYLLQHFDLEKYSSGSGVPTLNRNFVHSEIVTIPENYSDQKNIVTQLDELKSKSQLIQSNYLRELVALDELKKSILQKAFEGELT